MNIPDRLPTALAIACGETPARPLFGGKSREEVIKLWTAALRSGEYRQTRERLRNDAGGFCCLGVLCDLNAKSGGDQWAQGWGVTKQYMDEELNLPQQLAEFIVKPDLLNEETSHDRIVGEFAIKNDSGASFAHLADIIEARLL